MADDDNDGENRRGPLIGLGVAVLLLLLRWLLAHELYLGGKMEDCILSGRTNCAPIETPPR